VNRVRPPHPGMEDLVAYDVKDVRADVMLHANENPHNLPGELLDKLAERVRNQIDFNRYPDPMTPKLRALVAEANGLEPSNVLVGNGGDEIIMNVVLAWGGHGRTLVDMPPTFAMYGIDARVTGTSVIEVPRGPEFEIDRDAVLKVLANSDPDIVVVANPNNPTGTIADERVLLEILEATDALVLVDEAYFEFSRTTMRPHMDRHPNLAILRTLSKAFSFAALRCGYLLANEHVISELTKVRQPYSVNRFTQMAATLAYRDRMVFEAGVRETMRVRDRLAHGLDALTGVEVFPSEANFVLFKVEHASAVWRDLLHNHSILIRDVSRTPGLEDCLRVTVGTEDEIERFLKAMDEITASQRASSLFGVNATARRHQFKDGE